MELLRLVLRVHIDPSALVARSYPIVVLVGDHRQQLPPRRRVGVLRVHEPAELRADVLEGVRGERHADVVVTHLAGDRVGLYLRIVDAVLHLLLRGLVVRRTVHPEDLVLPLALQRLVGEVVELGDVVQRHPRELLQTVVELGEVLVVLAPVEPDGVPDVHPVDDGVEVLPVLITLSQQVVHDERSVESEVVEEHPLAVPLFDLEQEALDVVAVELHPEIAADEAP